MKQEVIKAINKATGIDSTKIDILLEVPPNQELGDFAFPCFILAREMKKNPNEISKELASKINQDLFDRVDSKGAYVNFFLNKSKYVESVLDKLQRKDFGKGNNNGKIIVDYSSPNVAKHFGIHNLRSTLIGNSICHLLKFSGYDVKSIDHLGDWGTQFGKLIVAYKKFSEGKKIDSIQELNQLYVDFHDAAEKDQSLEDLAREEFKKLEKGDKENEKLWNLFIKISLKEFEKIYKILGIEFDEIKGESSYRSKVSEIIEIAKQKGLAKESQGALVIELDGEKPPLILEKSNESSNYHSRDLAAIKERFSFNPEMILYVVDIAQSLHFEQVFESAGKLGFDSEKLIHVKFGRLSFKDMKMSTRKGQVILFEDLLSKASDKVFSLIEQKSPNLKDKKGTAQKVALASIIFNDLKNFRTHDIIFDWESALNFEGRTGSYILYTNSRASSIVRKSKKSVKKVNFSEISEKEFTLVKKLAEFPDIVKKATDQYAPSVLAEYSYNLCQIFNEFYHSCQVIDSEYESRRILIINQFNSILEKSLFLLGMPIVSEM